MVSLAFFCHLQSDCFLLANNQDMLNVMNEFEFPERRFLVLLSIQD